MLSRVISLARKCRTEWYHLRARSPLPIGDHPVVAGMATMPSRAATFPTAFRSIVHQVDRLYLYLDGHQEVPEVARNDARVIPIFSRDEPALGGAGKFIALIREAKPCLFLGVDDDIDYPPNYVARLLAPLKAHGSKVIVGFHGCVLDRPLACYRRNRKIFHFADALECEQAVDTLGSGTIMFDTSVFRFDIRRWQQLNMSDLNVAVEASKSALPLICVAREKNFLVPIDQVQSDSIFQALEKDSSRQTSRAHELLAMRAAKIPLRRTPKIEIFGMHGVTDHVRRDRFQHRNLLEAEQFCAFLRSGEKFVPLADALEGYGRALTIDDATMASARAAKLARQCGHPVTLFVNPWHIEVRQPYWFSRLNALLDRVETRKFSRDGRDFNLTSYDGKSELRTHIKVLMRRHIIPEQNIALIDELEEQLGVEGNEIPHHDHCLSMDDLRDLHGAGVDIQNHSWTHLDPLAGSLTQFTNQFHKARSWLKDRLAVEAGFFASPFGEFLPHPDFLRDNDTVCLLLHNDILPGNVGDRIINRIELRV